MTAGAAENGAAPHAVTAAEIEVFVPGPARVRVSARVTGAAPIEEALDGGTVAGVAGAPAAPVVWRRRAGTTMIVHAFAEGTDVPLCQAAFRRVDRFERLPPPPAHLGFYRRCRHCQALAGRIA